MKLTSILLQATGLLLTVDGYKAGAESVEGADELNRELIGLIHWNRITSPPTPAPTSTPTSKPTYAPEPNGYHPSPPPDTDGYYVPPPPPGGNGYYVPPPPPPGYIPPPPPNGYVPPGYVPPPPGYVPPPPGYVPPPPPDGYVPPPPGYVPPPPPDGYVPPPPGYVPPPPPDGYVPPPPGYVPPPPPDGYVPPPPGYVPPPPPGDNGYYPPPPAGGDQTPPPIPGKPTKFPTKPPTPFPTLGEPTGSPTAPTAAPSPDPSSEPSEEPTIAPTGTPSEAPTKAPTVEPTPKPTKPKKTKAPTRRPTERPSAPPSESAVPSSVPSFVPTSVPSSTPSSTPSSVPTSTPSSVPTPVPSSDPTSSFAPSSDPTLSSAPSLSSAPTSPFTVGGRSYFDIDLKKATGKQKKTIFEIICDTESASIWGTLCTVLKEAEIFEFLAGSEHQYTLFAPTNEAFENGDYSLELLQQNKAATQSLMSIHITQSVLSYDDLTCNLGVEMLNYYHTDTLCIGSVKVQNADGNELRNLPIIDEPSDILAKNGIIHPVSNVIVPLGFSAVDIQLIESAAGNMTDAVLDFVGNPTGATQNEGTVSSTESDVDEAASLQNDSDSQSTIIADVSTKPTVGEVQLTLGDIMQSLSNLAANRDSTNGNRCQVCANRSACSHPPLATVLFPGEGPMLCADVVDRQNSPEGIVLGRSMCSALQQRFNEYCISAGN